MGKYLALGHGVAPKGLRMGCKGKISQVLIKGVGHEKEGGLPSPTVFSSHSPAPQARSTRVLAT